MTQGVVDVFEEVDVAQDERQGASITRGAFDFAREVLAEEAPARDAGEIVRRRQLAVLDQRHAQYGFQLRDAPRHTNSRGQLPIR